MGYKIDLFEFDVDRGRLSRDGKEIHLRPKTFQVAAYLIANRDRLVSKVELMDACWKDIPVTDDVLTQAIVELRRALADNPRDPQYIQTVPRRGFRFIAPVEQTEPVLLEANETITTVEVREEDFHRTFHWAGLGLVRRSCDPSGRRLRSLAVPHPGAAASLGRQAAGSRIFASPTKPGKRTWIGCATASPTC